MKVFKIISHSAKGTSTYENLSKISILPATLIFTQVFSSINTFISTTHISSSLHFATKSLILSLDSLEFDSLIST